MAVGRAVGNLLVRIGADTGGLRKGGRDAETAMQRMSRQARQTATRLAKLTAAAVAAGAAIAAELTRRGLNAVDAQAKLARQLGVTQAEIAGVTRAAQDAGIAQGQLESNLTAMNKRLGEARQGTGRAADTLDRLGLSADVLVKMPLDQRMDAIGAAIQGLETEADRASATADIFSRSGLGMMNVFAQGEGAIQAATDEMRGFGVAVSEVDAARIEAANDAMSRISDVVQGIANQLASELAPLLEGIARTITGAASEAGGFRQQIVSIVDTSVRGFGLMADGVRGFIVLIKGASVGFQALGSGILGTISMIHEGWSRIFAAIAKGLRWAAEQANKLPFVNIEVTGLEKLESGFESAAEEQDKLQKRMADSLKQSVSELHDMLMEPLPSHAIDDWVRKAREGATEVSNALNIDDPGGDDEEAGAQEAASRHMDRLRERLDRIAKANLSEFELIRERHDQELEAINEARETQLITEQEWDDKMRDTRRRHNDEMNELERRAADTRGQIAEREAQHRQRVLGGAMTSLNSLMSTESRKMFEIGKTAAISNSIVSTYQGMSKALELGWPLGPIAAAAIGAAGFANVASIKSQSFGGSGGGAAASGAALPSASASGGGTQPQAGGTTVIQLEGETFGAQQVRNLIERINDEVRGGSSLLIA